MSLLLLLDDDEPPRRRLRLAAGQLARRLWRGRSLVEETMRPVSEWTEEDLRQLVKQKRQEDAELEYKDSRALLWPKSNNEAREHQLNELSKDVSAFANSNGGLLIYGIAERSHVPVRVDDGVDPRTHGREWLEDIIRSNIKDPPPGLRVYSIPIGQGGHVAHVVSVPMFPRGCQARDSRYYRRRNFRVDVLDDWEVRELLARPVQPEVSLQIGKQCVKEAPDEYFLVVGLHNIGTTRVYDWKVPLEVPHELITQTHASHSHIVRVSDGGGYEYDARMYHFTNGHGGGALFPGEPHELLGGAGRNMYIRLKDDAESQALVRERGIAVRWTLYADDLPPRSGTILVRDIPELG